MVALNVDLRNVNASIGGGVPLKPEGWYTGAVVKSESQGTRDVAATGNTMLVLTFAFQDGSSPYVERLNIWHQKEDTKRIAYENLAALCRASGMTDAEMAVGDSNTLHNRPIEMFIGQQDREYEGKKTKTNYIAALRMKDGKVIGNVPVTPPAGAQTAGGPAGGFSPAAPQAGGFAPQAPGQPWGGAAAAPGAPTAPAAPAAPPAPAFPQPGAAPAAPGGFPQPGAAPGGFPTPGAPAPGFPAPGGAPAPGFPTPGAAPGGFPAPGAPAGGGFPQPGGWPGPQG